MFNYILRFLKWTAISMVLLAVLGIGGVYLFYGAPALGKDALTLMSKEQKRVATKLLPSIAVSANVDQISKVLGEPIENDSARVKWAGPVQPKKTRITAYYIDGKISKVTYLSVEPFWGWKLYAENGKLKPAD